MKIPFTQLELAHVRKALSAGAVADAPLILADVHAHVFNTGRALDLVGAFLGAVLVVYNVPNKDLEGVVRVADQFLGDALPDAAPVINVVNQVAAAAEAVPAEPQD